MKKINIILTFMLISLLFNSSYSTTNKMNIMPGDDDYLAYAEDPPAPVGGMSAIIKHIVYPNIAKQARIEGKVYVLAYIDENGHVHDAKVIRGIGGGCDEAAINAVRQSKFTPGKNKGVNCKVKLSLAIQFKL